MTKTFLQYNIVLPNEMKKQFVKALDYKLKIDKKEYGHLLRDVPPRLREYMELLDQQTGYEAREGVAGESEIFLRCEEVLA